MTDDLARILNALKGVDDPVSITDRLAAALDDALGLGRAVAPAVKPARGRGRPPALTPEQVRVIRLRRALPLSERPRLTELAAQFRVHVKTIHKALQAVPPYDFGTPALHNGSAHRDRGRYRDRGT